MVLDTTCYYTMLLIKARVYTVLSSGAVWARGGPVVRPRRRHRRPGSGVPVGCSVRGDRQTAARACAVGRSQKRGHCDDGDGDGDSGGGSHRGGSSGGGGCRRTVVGCRDAVEVPRDMRQNRSDGRACARQSAACRPVRIHFIRRVRDARRLKRKTATLLLLLIRIIAGAAAAARSSSRRGARIMWDDRGYRAAANCEHKK